MRIYVAAPWKDKKEARKAAKFLRDADLVVVSRWHDNEFDENVYEAPPEVMALEAERDLEDLAKMDTLVYLNLRKSEGKATELGIAIERGCHVYVIGGKENNVFLHSSRVEHVESVEAAIDKLRS